MRPPHVVAYLADAIQSLPRHRPLRVGVDGRSGAGKTTLADALADALEAAGRVCLRASLDDFHPPGHLKREKSGDFTPADYLREAYDYPKLLELLLNPFAPKGNRRCRLDYWNAHDDQPFPEEWIDVQRDAILVVDGLFLHAPPLRGQWDFTLWLDVDWQNALRRRAQRDGTPGSSAELVRDAYATGWIPRHVAYEQSVRPHERVDVVIDNSDVEHPNIVRAPRPRRTAP
jgi:uridine kinase